MYDKRGFFSPLVSLPGCVKSLLFFMYCFVIPVSCQGIQHYPVHSVPFFNYKSLELIYTIILTYSFFFFNISVRSLYDNLVLKQVLLIYNLYKYCPVVILLYSTPEFRIK